MKVVKKLVWLVISILMVLSLIIASCGKSTVEEEEEEVTEEKQVEEEEEKVVEEEEVEPSTTGEAHWWDYHGKPQYGGTLTIRWATAPFTWDPYRSYSSAAHLYMEHLSGIPWTLDRKIWAFDTMWTRDDLLAPLGLAESWEQPDGYTQIFHIREGVNWQNKDPANGRELTAEDIAWSFNRLIGKGSGFNKPSPYFFITSWAEIDSITATDKYTMTVKYNKPNDYGMLANFGLFEMMCPDVVNKYGNCEDWKNAVGTGPWIVNDYVTATSVNLSKNPNYWGVDERNPENKIPYFDKLKVLIVQDASTAYAAVRTGKIDQFGGIPSEQAESLLKTNPELNYKTVFGTPWGLLPKIDKEPFTDIRVRKAMNMAINRKAIGDSYRGGKIEGIPYGILIPTMGEYYTPFQQWPQNLQEEYSYNPEAARALLTEAGYPNGFKTKVTVSSVADADEVQIFVADLAAVGINMEIELMESGAFTTYVTVNAMHDLAWSGVTAPMPKVAIMGFETPNWKGVNDPVYNEMGRYYRINVDEQGNYLTLDEMLKRAKACEIYVLSQHWMVPSVPALTYNLWQPWLKGYSGEFTGVWPASQYARWWFDQSLKQ